MKTPDYAIVGRYKVQALCEFTLETDGLSYLVIYGTHINGGFCAIPNHGISCEMGTPSDTFYNYEALTRQGLCTGTAKAIAAAIWENLKPVEDSKEE